MNRDIPRGRATHGVFASGREQEARFRYLSPRVRGAFQLKTTRSSLDRVRAVARPGLRLRAGGTPSGNARADAGLEHL